MMNLRNMTGNSINQLKESAKDLLKPHEYQLLLISAGVGIGIEKILNQVGVDIKDIPSDALSGPIIATGFLTTAISAYQFSTGKSGDVSSKAKVDEIIQELSQTGDKLKGMCDLMYFSMRDTEENTEKLEKVNELRRKLKYTYLAMLLLGAYIIRDEKGPCFECFDAICNKWFEEKDQTQDTNQGTQNEQIAYYENLFSRAIKDSIDMEGFNEKITSDNTSLIVEVINKLEDYYHETFTEFANSVGMPFSTLEEALAIAQLTDKVEVETLKFLKQTARNRRFLFYGLLSLSAASMNRTEDVEALAWLENYFIKDVLDYFATHANAIVGTTVSYIAMRAIGTLNANNIITNFVGRRLIPDTKRIQVEDKENNIN